MFTYCILDKTNVINWRPRKGSSVSIGHGTVDHFKSNKASLSLTVNRDSLTLLVSIYDEERLERDGALLLWSRSPPVYILDMVELRRRNALYKVDRAKNRCNLIENDQENRISVVHLGYLPVQWIDRVMMKTRGCLSEHPFSFLFSRVSFSSLL